MNTGINKELTKDGRAKDSPYKKTLLSMDVGDSVEHQILVIQSLANQARTMGISVTTRKTSHLKRRLWRVK